MNPVTLRGLGTAFSVFGVLAALPSLGMLVFYAVAVVPHRMAAAPAGLDAGAQADGLLLVLAGMVQVASLLGRLAEVVLDMLAAAAACGLVLGLACWCTGRGLRRHAAWARVGAAALLAPAGLVAAVLALSLQDAGRCVPAAAALACVLGLHALWRAPGRTVSCATPSATPSA